MPAVEMGLLKQFSSETFNQSPMFRPSMPAQGRPGRNHQTPRLSKLSFLVAAEAVQVARARSRVPLDRADQAVGVVSV